MTGDLGYRIYDADDRMFRQDDGDGHCTTFSFDGFDRKSGITYYGGSCYTGGPSGETFGYTINDGLDYDQTRAGNVITATYDVLGRLATRSTGPEISYPSTAAFNYNAGSQISRVSRGGDRADWDNGPFSRQWLSLYRTDGLKAEDIFPDYKALKYEYDANGNRTALDWADGHNALATNSSGAYLLGGEPVQYRAASFYDKVNRLTQIQYGDNVHSLVGSVQLSGLDAFGREQVRYLGGNVDFDNAICWTYDKSGTGTNLTALRHVVGGTNYCGAATTALENDYTYDAAHRVLTQSTIGLTIARPPAAASLAYGAPTGTNAIPTVAAAALSYDLDGNLYSAPYAGSAYGGNSGDAPVAKPDRYNFDYQGRLVTAYAGADIYNYAYDPFGRRTTKIKNAVIATLTLQDDRGDDVGDYDSAGNPVTRYIHNGREVAPVAAVSAADGSFRFNRFDRLGSVVAVTQGTGTAATVVAQTAYLPYGAPAGGSVIGSAFGYAGYRYDTETGLYHTASRYYDPRLGRFLTPDPIGYAGGINYYAYVNNDPVNFTDPSGLFADAAYNAAASGANYALTHPGQMAGAALASAGIVACTLSPCVVGELALAGGAAAGGGIALTTTGVAASTAVVGGTILMNQDQSNSGDPGPYSRPSNATTPAQRASVQGQPCVTCGKVTDSQVADHIDPLVEQYYRNGGNIDMTQARSVNAVQPQCPTCSARQGGFLSGFSRAMRSLFGY